MSGHDDGQPRPATRRDVAALTALAHDTGLARFISIPPKATEDTAQQTKEILQRLATFMPSRS